MKWTLETIEIKVLELKEMATKLKVDERNMEQLVMDLYRIEMTANGLREAINKMLV